MLKLKDVNVHYGAIHALKNISIEVNEGEIVTLIGANGSGKTSTLRAISGLEKITGGNILYKDDQLDVVAANDIVKKGIAHVPEGRRVFANLTVYENLEMGAYIHKNKKEIKESLEMVFEKFPRLKERSGQLAGTLSGGEQQMLAMGRALMIKPKLLLLDEPSMGLAPLIVKDIFSIIKEINQNGTTVLLVGQNAHAALHVAHRGYVLETGRIVLSGEAKALLNDDKIKEAYLGH